MGELNSVFRKGQKVYIIPESTFGIVDDIIDAHEKYPSYPIKYQCSFERGSISFTGIYEEHELRNA